MTKNNRDWVGVGRAPVFKTLGASNHTEEEREQDDFYATDPIAADLLHSVEEFPGGIWECSAGMGHLSQRFEELGHKVISTDLIDRGYGQGGVDFLKVDKSLLPNIVTNPPYKFAQEFVEHGINILPIGGKLALFLKLQFLEGKARKEMFMRYPPHTVYVCSGRVLCAKNGDFERMKAGGGSAVAYCWYVWRRGEHNSPIIKWIN